MIKLFCFKKNIKFFIPDKSNETRFINIIQNSLELKKKFLVDKRRKADYLPIFAYPFFLNDISEDIINNTVKEYYDKGLDILVDFSTESLIFDNDEHPFSKKLVKFHQYIEDKGIEPGRIVLLNANSADRKHFSQWCARNKVMNPVKVVGYDFYLYESIPAIRKFFKTENLAKTIIEKSFTAQLRPKKFSCLNLKAKIHRYCIAAKVLNAGDNTISFFSKIEDAEKDMLDKFVSQLEPSHNTIQNIKKLEEIIPVTLDFDEKNKLEGRIYLPLNSVNVWQALLLFENDTSVLFDSYIDVVSETWFTDDTCCFISEKTMRPILTLKPFIVTGSPFTLKRLKELGFKSFSPAINEEYDTVTDPVKRMSLILNEIERLNKLTKEQLHELYNSCKATLLHNFKLLTQKTELSAKDISKIFK